MEKMCLQCGQVKKCNEMVLCSDVCKDNHYLRGEITDRVYELQTDCEETDCFDIDSKLSDLGDTIVDAVLTVINRLHNRIDGLEEADE